MNNIQKLTLALFTALTTQTQFCYAVETMEIHVNTGDSATVLGSLSGAVVKVGAGTAVFSSTDNEDLALTLTAGTVSISDANNLGSLPNGSTTLNGGTLEATATLALPTPFALSANSTLRAATGAVVSTGAPTGSHVLTVEGAGAVALTGNNSASDSDLSIATGGTVRVAAANNLFGDNILSGGTLRATAAITIDKALAVNANSTLQADADVTLGAAPTGTEVLTIANNSGTGAVIAGDLSGSSTPLTVVGVLQAGAANSLLTTGAKTVEDGGTLRLAGIAAGAVPGTTEIKSGGTLEVTTTSTVPSGTSVINSLKFESGSKLKLGNGAIWARPITVGTAS